MDPGPAIMTEGMPMYSAVITIKMPQKTEGIE